MIPVSFKTDEELDVVNVDGKPYLFTNLRVDRETLPEGFVKYDVRDSGSDGMFRQIKAHVLVKPHTDKSACFLVPPLRAVPL